MDDTKNDETTTTNNQEKPVDEVPEVKSETAENKESEPINADAEAEKKAEEATQENTKQNEDTNKNGGDEANVNGAAAATTDSDYPKLFVGRLPFGTKDSHLKQLFSTYGEVTHCDIVGKYGFVHMKIKEEANEAMKKLNNHNFNGSNISVQLSTSTAKKTKRKPNKKKSSKPNTSSNNGTSNSNNNSNNKTKMNNNQTPNNNNNNRRINNRYDKFRNNRPRSFNRPMNGPPMHSMPPNMNYYQQSPPPFMNNSPYYQPHPQQMPPNSPMRSPGGPPRDMYYNRSPEGYGYRSNGPPPPPPPQPMYAQQPGPNIPPPPPAQNYNYNNRGMGQGPMNQPANHYQQPMYPPVAGPSGCAPPPQPPMNAVGPYGSPAPPMRNSYGMNNANKYGYY